MNSLFNSSELKVIVMWITLSKLRRKLTRSSFAISKAPKEQMERDTGAKEGKPSLGNLVANVTMRENTTLVADTRNILYQNVKTVQGPPLAIMHD